MRTICFLVVIIAVACSKSTATADKEAEAGLKAPLAKSRSAQAVQPARELTKIPKTVVDAPARAAANETAAPKPPPRVASAPLPAATRKLAKPQRSRQAEISTTMPPLLPLTTALPQASNSTASSISSSGRGRHIRSLLKKLFLKSKKFHG